MTLKKEHTGIKRAFSLHLLQHFWLKLVRKNLEGNPNGKYDLSKCLASPEVVALIESRGLLNCSTSRGFDDDRGSFRSGPKKICSVSVSETRQI